MIVSYPEQLLYLRILVIKDYEKTLMDILQSSGSIHPEVLGKIPEEDKKRIESNVKKAEQLATLISQIESLLVGTRLVEVKEYIDLAKVDEYLDKLLLRLSEIYEKASTLSHNLEKISENISNTAKILEILNVLKDDYGSKPVKDLSYLGDLIFSTIIRGGEASIKVFLNRLPNDIFVANTYRIEENYVLVVMGLTAALRDLKELCRDLKLEIISMPQIDESVDSYLRRLQNRLEDLKMMKDEMLQNLKELVNSSVEDLALAKVIHEVISDRLNAVMKALMSENLLAIEGWVPISEYPVLESKIVNEIPYSYIVESRTDIEPPIKMKNPKHIKSFELITKIYGVPRHKEWDPTPIIGYSFLIFFGLMFADFIYGLIMLFIVTFVLDRSGLIDNPSSEGYLTLKKMLKILSISSMFFGVLSNTFGGYQLPWLPTILNLTEPIDFIKLSLIIGLVHVNLAHILSFAKGIKFKDYPSALAEVGLFIAEGFGIPYILHSFLSTDIFTVPPEVYGYFLYGALGGVAILVVSRLIGLKGLGGLMWLFDITGVLGDVLSYTRLAGIGLATYLMAKSFNDLALGVGHSIAATVSLPIAGVVAGVIVSFTIMFFANALNVAFGIIGAFVHSLRLCFVEFLPKFYEGGGKEFKPLVVRISKYVPVGRAF
jgi:V/A-type H+-transporting ATPase subunit I